MPSPRCARRSLLALFASSLVLAGTVHCAGCPTRDDPPIVVDPTCALAVNDRDYAVAALADIAAAERRIHVVEYVIYNEGPVHDLLAALVEAAGRGVEVSLLADETSSSTASALAYLEAGGVEVSLDSPDTTTHNKLIVADDVTLVGSHNLSTAALSYNNEASVRIDSPEVTAYYDRYIQALWEDPDAEPALGDAGTEPVVPIHDRAIAEHLEACIAEASDRIRVVMYAVAFNDDYPTSDVNRLVHQLVDANDRGVDVAVILDHSQWIVENEINVRAAEVLEEGGVALRHAPPSETTHAKVVVCDDTAIVGDANWSYSAFTSYHGTSVEVTGGSLAEDYVDWFGQLWERSSER